MQKILVASDGSPCSLKACDTALDYARRFPGCQIILVNVSPLSLLDLATYRIPMAGEDLLPQQLEERLTRNSEEILATSLKHLGDTKEVPVSTRSVLGHAAEVICDMAADEKADLVIVGSRGHGKLHRMILGSVSAQVVNHCPCAVLVTRD